MVSVFGPLLPYYAGDVGNCMHLLVISERDVEIIVECERLAPDTVHICIAHFQLCGTLIRAKKCYLRCKIFLLFT